MRPSTIWYTLKQGIKNIKRNFMFSIASIITMAACIFLFGIFFSIVNNVNTLAHKVEEDVPITVLFNEGTTQEQMDAVGELIRQRPEVSKIEFESGDEAWEKMKQEYFGDDSEAADGFKDDNPLANSSNYRVYMNSLSWLPTSRHWIMYERLISLSRLPRLLVPLTVLFPMYLWL